MENEAEGAESTKGSVIKVIAVAAVALVLVALGLFVLTRSASRMTSVTAAQPVPANVQSDPKVAPSREVRRDVAKESTPQPNSTARSEDEELKRLRERRIAATSSDRAA